MDMNGFVKYFESESDERQKRGQIKSRDRLQKTAAAVFCYVRFSFYITRAKLCFSETSAAIFKKRNLLAFSVIIPDLRTKRNDPV